ncbi:hypothetical protein KBD33_00300 [Candidatus Gracilibacteria bacterium]|nr:hypothetical protein [Candidatus Gracilibacteria bacterium]
MSEYLSIITPKRRNRGTLIEIGMETVEKIPMIPNFEEIDKFREFLSVELEKLLILEEQGIFEVSTFVFEDIKKKLNIRVNNIKFLVQEITNNGIYGELSHDGTTITLTKEGIKNLDIFLEAQNLEDYLENALLKESDFKGGKANTTILTIGRLIRERGLEQLAGISGVGMTESAFKNMEDGIDFEDLPSSIPSRKPGIRLLPPGITRLIELIEGSVKEAMQKTHKENQ